MIKNIQKLQNFGIFRSYNNSNTQDFGKLNLIYGWNGSGKSTLSTLFESLEKRQLPDLEKFPSPIFSVNPIEGLPITNDNISNCALNIRTFNQSFIRDNINWDNSVKSILLVAKEKISERKDFDTLKNKQNKDIYDHEKNEGDIKKLNDEISKFLTDSSKRTKTNLQVIDTKDSRYLNYNKTKLQDFIIANEQNVKSDSSILPADEISRLIDSAKPNQKPEIDYQATKINPQIFDKAKSRLDELLKKSAASKIIERLAQNPEVQTWVSDGLRIHKESEQKICEFCRNEVNEDRIRELEGHFSDDFKILKDSLTKADEWLAQQYITLDGFPLTEIFYDEYREAYKTSHQEISISAEKINAEIKYWHSSLALKIENPFNTNIIIEEVSKNNIDAYNECAEQINHTLSQHNKKTKNFEQETKKSKERLELHYATSEAKAFGYFAKLIKSESLSSANKTLGEKIGNQKEEIDKIEASLSNESLGASQFNKTLHKFLGRSELSLKFNKDKMGYEIIRNGAGSHDGNLSEGEKTAVAFVYFITKLTENNNRIQDTTVIVDDPLSSFDSNHIFHAYSFLRTSCLDAKQIIILTHNFTFFKLIRDWFANNNANREKSQKNPVAFFFMIESSNENPRQSTLKNADESLVAFNSEYHYVFSRLYAFINNTSLSRDEAFLTANLTRKLLEAFFSFKYPGKKSDLAILLESGLNGCTDTTPVVKEKIYRFIGRYSHSNSIDIDEDSAENLLGESNNVVRDVFRWMEEADEGHYKEMLSLVS